LCSDLSGLSAECKADLILANEDRLRKTNALYRSFTDKKSCLNSDALQVPGSILQNSHFGRKLFG
jgi:hypothetical protein